MYTQMTVLCLQVFKKSCWKHRCKGYLCSHWQISISARNQRWIKGIWGEFNIKVWTTCQVNPFDCTK